VVRRRHHPPGSNTTHQLIDAHCRAQTAKPRLGGCLPLTAAAWEGLFERLNIQDAGG
jgi:hypothetical protein